MAITRVALLDNEFNAVKELTDAALLKEFERLWSARKEAEPGPRTWSHKLDVKTDGRSERWQYDSAGYLDLLSEEESPSYRVPDAAALNALLGLA